MSQLSDKIISCRNCFLKDKISYNSLMHLLIHVTPASTVDHSTLLPYSIRVAFDRSTGKNSDLLWHSNKRLVELNKM
jgi:hypothetical protein